MEAFSGASQEVRAHIAFTTIITKIQNSDSRIYWNYLIKNLIVLDYSVEYMYFLQDIKEMYLPNVESFVDKDQSISE